MNIFKKWFRKEKNKIEVNVNLNIDGNNYSNNSNVKILGKVDENIDERISGLFFKNEKDNNKNFEKIDFDEIGFDEITPEKITIAKIEELKAITTNIQKKKLTNVPDIEFNKFKIDYKSNLNEEQLLAVLAIDIPLLVIAGAGSGKTRVITYKVSFLIENGVEANNILLLTFTRKSAEEMLNRVKILLGKNQNDNIIGGTFHSFSNYILRKYNNLLDIDSKFSIIDSVDAEDIIDLVKNELQITKKTDCEPFPLKKIVFSIISKSRNLELDIGEVIAKYYDKYICYIQEIEKISIGYSLFKKKGNLYDYDDLLIELRNKLVENEKFAELLSKNITHILVDEYQDTNKVQNDIIKLLGKRAKSITVVGDDIQSIYGFRGANYENILRFPEDFPDSKIVMLINNYRSGKGIVNFTNEIIKNSKIGFKKTLVAIDSSKNKPVFNFFPNQEHEAEFIVKEILNLRDNDLDFNNFAILTRANWHSNYVQTELMKENIPFVVIGGIKFAEKRHVKDVVAFLKIHSNSLDTVSWHRILTLIDGIGNIRAKEIVNNIHQNNGQINFTNFKKNKYYNELSKFQDLFNDLININNIQEKILCINKYYKPLLEKIEIEFKKKFQDLDILVDISKKYNKIEEFLSAFVLDPPNNRYQENNNPMKFEDSKPLTVSTIHSAKGLEWHSVFLPHCIDGLFPSVKSMDSFESIEEERRLFYVASSRAKANLYISMPSSVNTYNGNLTKPSRFLCEINKSKYKYD